MSTKHTISQGECLSSIAKKYGFSDYKTIYNHPENAAFKTKRPNPNVIFQGDILTIPDKEIKEVDGATEAKHTFKIKREKTFLRLVVKDSEDKAFANVDYVLKIGDETITGKTSGAGKVEQEIVADATSGELVLRSKSGANEIIGVIELELGSLDPVEENTGVQARLNNLGFPCGAENGTIGAETQEAIKAFQHKHGLTESGNADDATRTKLRQIHDLE